jgi:hypothetical protein
MKISRAYSLIELSTIILIIGILIGGIKAGSELLIKSRLKNARALTSSSYAALVDDMILWLDATAEGSMVNGSGSVKVQDADKIQTWKDVNPQVTSKFSFTQGTDARRPIYEDNGINGLPTLFFDAADDGMVGDAIYVPYSSTSILNPATFTLFAVVRPIFNTSANGYIIANQSGSTGFYFKRVIAPTYAFQMIGYNGTTNIQSTEPTAFTHGASYISTISTNGVAQTIYRNGSQQDSDAVVAAPNTSGDYIIGSSSTGAAGNSFDGYISEIIMYSRALRKEERQEIEKYLGKKYGIQVPPS